MAAHDRVGAALHLAAVEGLTYAEWLAAVVA